MATRSGTLRADETPRASPGTAFPTERNATANQQHESAGFHSECVHNKKTAPEIIECAPSSIRSRGETDVTWSARPRHAHGPKPKQLQRERTATNAVPDSTELGSVESAVLRCCASALRPIASRPARGRQVASAATGKWRYGDAGVRGV